MSGITRPLTLPDHLVPIWAELEPQFHPRIGAAGLEAACIQVHRMRDAQERVTREGAVVADSKGNPCAHPALAIEKDASAQLRTWLEKFPAPAARRPGV